MFLHLSSDVSLKKQDIVGVFDMDTATVSPVSREFLKRAQTEGKLKTVLDAVGIPKSFIAMEDGSVIICQLSSSVVLGRIKELW